MVGEFGKMCTLLRSALLVGLMLVFLTGGRLPTASAQDSVTLYNVSTFFTFDPDTDGMKYKIDCSWGFDFPLPHCVVNVYRVVTFKDANGDPIGDANRETLLYTDLYYFTQSGTETTHGE